MVVVDSGTLIDGDGFNFGSQYQAVYTLNKPAGIYTYTFIFGYRSTGHSWYDLAVEVSVEVGEEASPLMADASTLFETGGTVDFFLAAGAANSSRNYLIVGGTSGTNPGFLLPGGMVTLPVNWDWFSDLEMTLLNSFIFFNFLGTLDTQGKASAQLYVPPMPTGTAGLKMYYAYCCNNPFDFVSNPVTIEVVE
jgi:hypothetical protein